jgi:hypothetical protein
LRERIADLLPARGFWVRDGGGGGQAEAIRVPLAKTQGIDTSDSTGIAEVSVGPTDDGGVGLAVAITAEILRQGPGVGRAGAPDLPLLQGHPRQHRRHRHRRFRGLQAGERMMVTWPSACSTC